MARMPRLVVAGQPHLVIQRAGEQAIFRDDSDRQCYVDALAGLARGSTVAVHAFVLLDDQVMLLVSPRDVADLGNFMQRLNRRYVPAFHRRHGGSGALWAGRFQAAALEPERYLLRCTVMMEQASVRSGVVGMATDWAWSSARHHAGRGASPVITEHAVWWQTGNTPFEREARHEIELQQALRAEQVSELLSAARGGWPLGSAGFIGEVAQSSDRPVSPNPRGRPKRLAAPNSVS